MSRGLGSVQQKVLEIVNAATAGVPVDAIVTEVFGRQASPANVESVRRAIRTLDARGLVRRTTRWETRPRKSIKRLVDLSPCEGEFCHSCAQRKHRERLLDWHRRAMRTNAKHDPAWLQDLARAEATGFVHATASAERLTDSKPNAVDSCDRRLQVVLPR